MKLLKDTYMKCDKYTKSSVSTADTTHLFQKTATKLQQTDTTVPCFFTRT